MDRFRVDAGNHDLLRSRINARGQLHDTLIAEDGFYWRKSWFGRFGPLHGPMRKGAVLEAFDNWGLSANRFAIGRKAEGKFVPHVAADYVPVRWQPVSSCTAGVSNVWSLAKEQFPPLLFGGGYVYKESYPGYWSDHSWGTAVDLTQNSPKVKNDDVFDWLVAMQKEGCLDFDYVLGSRDGHVVKCDREDGYEVRPSDADSGHLWHCHVSVVDHHGARPPRPGGK